MKKLFVSVPMKGRETAAIMKSIAKMKAIAETVMDEELELIDSYIEDQPPKDNIQAVWFLGESIKKLSTADVFIGISDAYDWDGCYVEREVARRYGIMDLSVPPHYVIDNYDELMNERYKQHCPTCEPCNVRSCHD